LDQSKEEQKAVRSGNDEKLGLYKKFQVSRTDGTSEPGGKHELCDYFVLDLSHDQFALPAIEAYATACASKFPNLAEDLRQIAGALRKLQNSREVHQ
jgi:hypothetical protein